MQKMTKSILLSLTITAMVLLYLPRYTTVNASPVSEDLFPYQVWVPELSQLWVSDQPIFLYDIGTYNSNRPFYLTYNGSSLSFNTSSSYYHYFIQASSVNSYILSYDGSGWSANILPHLTGRSSHHEIYDTYSFYLISDTSSDYSTALSSTGFTFYYNFSYPSSVKSYRRLPKQSSLPSDLPAAENLSDVLNSTTSTTTSAQTAQNSLTTTYNKYLNGTASASSLQSKIDSTVSTLNTLNSVESNTLADLMAVNNGLTYAQTVQDKLNADELNKHLEVTSSVAINISGYLNVSNQAFDNYKNGVNTQSETISILQNQILNLNNMISNGVAKNSADVQAINTAINSVNGIISNVSNYSDLDSDLSDKVQNSDQAELDYLDSLSSDVTSSIQDMSAEKQFSSQQISQSQSILSAVWNLDILKRLIPLASVFMVVCVALGIKYKL